LKFKIEIQTNVKKNIKKSRSTRTKSQRIKRVFFAHFSSERTSRSHRRTRTKSQRSKEFSLPIFQVKEQVEVIEEQQKVKEVKEQVEVI